MDDSIFRQKGADQFPRGIENQAVDANPSELSGSTSVTRPVWEKFLTNTVAQENNQAAVRAENDLIHSANQMGESWKGADGKLLRKVGRQSEMLDAEAFTDHPVAGPEARKSLWDREVRTWRKDAQDAAFALRDPSFHAGAMTDKEREDALAEGSMLQETDPRHVELKSKLRADDDYRARKAELAQRSFDSEAKARELESTDPESWWSSRPVAKPSEQRAAVVADAQSRAGQADAASNSAAEEMAGIDAKLAQGVRGSEVDALKARRAEIATGQAVAAQEKAKAAEQVRGVQEQAKSDNSDFLRGAEVSLRQIPQLAYGVAGLIGDTMEKTIGVGASLRDWGLKGYADAEQKAAPLQREHDDVTKAWAKAKSGDLGALVDWAQYGLGYAFGQLGETLAVSAIGGLAGGAAGTAAEPGGGTLAGGGGGALAGLVAKGEVKSLAKGLIEKAIASQATKLAAKELAKDGAKASAEAITKRAADAAIRKAAAKEIGSNIAVMSNALGMEIGSIYPEAVKQAQAEGRELTGTDLARVWGMGLAAGGVEGLTDKLGIDLLKGKFADALPGGRVAGALVGGVADAAVEGGTEALQTGMERLGARQSLTDAEAQSDYINSAAMGAVGGAAVGGIGGAMGGEAPNAETERVATELAALDPEAEPPSRDEIALGAILSPTSPAEGVLVERELAAVESEDDQAANDAAANVEAVRATGDAKATKAAEESAAKVKPRAPLVRAVTKIAAGWQVDDLTSAELAAVGIAKSDSGEFSAMDDKELADAGIPTRMVDVGADGSIILTDGALKRVGEVSPRARGLVKMTEAEAIQKAKQRAAQQLSTDTQNGTVDSTGSNAPQGVPGDPASGVFSGPAPGVVPPHETNATVGTNPANPNALVNQPPAAPAANPEATGGDDPSAVAPESPPQLTQANGPAAIPKAGTQDAGTGNAPTNQGAPATGTGSVPAQKPVSTAHKAARSAFDKAKRKLKDRLTEGAERATTRPDGITINPKQIVDEALSRGMTDKQASDYFARVLDEEIRHLAQYDAARVLYRANGGTGDFMSWMESHYAGIWQSDFVATGKDAIIRDLYAKGSTSGEWRWDTPPEKGGMTDGDKALEAIRMMSQGDSVTEQGKLWANISESLKQAITAALAALKQFADIASPSLKSEITNLENALKQLNQSRRGDSKTGGKKPAPGKTGDGTGKAPQTERDSGVAGDRGAESERRDGAGSPLLVGSRVEFTKNGKTRTGKVEMIDKGSVLIRPDDNPGIAVGVDVGDVRVISAPSTSSASTPEVENQTPTPKTPWPSQKEKEKEKAEKAAKAAETTTPTGENSPAALTPAEEKARKVIDGLFAAELPTPEIPTPPDGNAWSRAMDRFESETGSKSRAGKRDRWTEISEEEESVDADYEKKLQKWLDAIPERQPISFVTKNDRGPVYAVVTRNSSTPEKPWRVTYFDTLPRPDWTAEEEIEYDELFKKTRWHGVGGHPDFNKWWERLGELNSRPVKPGSTRISPYSHNEYKTRIEAVLDAQRHRENPEVKVGTLFSSDLPTTYSRPIPQDRFMALMDAAQSLAVEGVDTPEKLAETMRKLASDNKAVPFTQSFWFALKAVGVEGPAEPDWNDVYQNLEKTNTSEGSVTPGDVSMEKDTKEVSPAKGKAKKSGTPASREASRLLNSQDTQLTDINKILAEGGKIQAPPAGMLKILRNIKESGSRKLKESERKLLETWEGFDSYKPKSAFGSTFNGKVAQEIHGRLFTQDKSNVSLDDWAGLLAEQHGPMKNDAAMIRIMDQLDKVARGVTDENSPQNPNRELTAEEERQMTEFSEVNQYDLTRSDMYPQDMEIGDTITLGGESFTLIAKRDGEAVLEDGTRFGTQRVPLDASLWFDIDNSPFFEEEDFTAESLVDEAEKKGYGSVDEFDESEPEIVNEIIASGPAQEVADNGSGTDDRSTSPEGKDGEVSLQSQVKAPASKMDVKNADSRELFSDDGGFSLVSDTTQDGDKIAAERKAKEEAKAAQDALQGDMFGEVPAASVAKPDAPIVARLKREVARMIEVHGELNQDRLNRAINDAAWSFAGDGSTTYRQDALEFLTGTRPPKAKSGVNIIAQELRKWVEKNPVGEVKADPSETVTPTTETVTEAPSAPGAVTNLDSLLTFLDSINEGTVTADQIKAAWQSYKDNEKAIFADLSKLTMRQLEQFQGMRRPDNKAQAVRQALSTLSNAFNPGEALSFMVTGTDFKKSMTEALDKAVASWTDEKVAEKAERHRAAREKREARIAEIKAKKEEAAAPKEDTSPESSSSDGTFPAPRGYPSHQENEARWKKEGKEREAAEIDPTAVESTAVIEQFSPEQAASELNKRGITLQKEATKNGKTVWRIKGKTFDVKDQLKALGAKWYAPAKAWSIFSDEDPTTRIANALAGKQVEGEVSQGSQDSSGTGGNADEDLRLKQLRERLDSNPDERGTRGDAISSVDAGTAELIRRGLKFGMPPSVVEDQIEDVAMITRAFTGEKPMFLLGNGAGTGKTFVLGGAIREMRAKGAKSFVYVTMNTDLIDQIKKDLADFGIQDVQFHTYSEMSTKPINLPDGAVLIFDEAHNVKNEDSSRGGVAQGMMGRAKFTIFASATPFENPVEAGYVAGTGIFNQMGGHIEFAKAYGANVRKYKEYDQRTGTVVEREAVYWTAGKLEDGIAARQWFARQGIMITRPMQLPMHMVESQFSKHSVDQKWVDMYNKVTQAYEAAMAEFRDEDGNLLNKQMNAAVSMHMVNTIKRILEASKVDQAVKRAQEILNNGGNVVLFVETKADRWIGRYRTSQFYSKKSGLYTYPEMREMMREWEMEAAMARKMGERPGPRPFAEQIMSIARAMHEFGLEFELPSVEQEIVERLGGKDKVGIYTGSVTAAAASKDKAAFLAGEKRAIVATMAKGGTGLSLHDRVGDRPTSQINLNLPWKASGVDQVSARVARYGLQSKANIDWLFAENIPFERSLAYRVGRRMRDMGAIVKGVDMKAANVLADGFDFEGSVDVKQVTGEVAVAETDIFEQAERMEKSRRQRGDQSNGFFETPFPLSALMTVVSGARGRLLEPSAGRGNLIRFAKDSNKVTSITLVEQRADNADYLEGTFVKDMDGARNQSSKITVIRGDFLGQNDLGQFDTIHMNPPFERKAGVGAQDVAHVMAAYDMLSPDGRLVAIMGEGAFFRSTKQEQEFRQWLDEVGAIVVRMPENAFKNSNTGVRTRMIVIDRNADSGRTDINLEDMDADSLRSVAEAIPLRDSGLQASELPSQENSEVVSFRKKWNDKGVPNFVSEHRGFITLHEIRVPKGERRNGIGTQFMKELVALSEKLGMPIGLSPSKDFGATSVDRLKGFYKRFGFVENKGRNKDFRVSQSMIRRPESGLRASPLPPAAPFYSQLSRIIEAKMPKSATPAQVLQIAASGAKSEEVKWSGIIPWLQGRDKVSKDEVLNWLANEGTVRFEEVALGGKSDPDAITEDGSVRTRYAQYTLPGGENYREVVLAMPVKDRYSIVKETAGGDHINNPYEEWWVIKNLVTGKQSRAFDTQEEAEAVLKEKGKGTWEAHYRSSHFPDVPNYVAHMRLNERTDSAGKPGLFIEELQSDRHQAGREKGYRDDFSDVYAEAVSNGADPTTTRNYIETLAKQPLGDAAGEAWRYLGDHVQKIDLNEAFHDRKDNAVADAPYRKDWPLALFKRALRDAVASGKEWIGWTVGETQNDRFDLSKQVDGVTIGRDGQTYWFFADKSGENVAEKEGLTLAQLAEHVGKDLAEKASSTLAEGTRIASKRFAGNDLKVGGSGMKGFYDNILPKEIGKYVKQWGGKVESGTIKGEENTDGLEVVLPTGEVIASTNYDSEAYRIAGEHRGASVRQATTVSKSTPIHRITITPEMRKGVEAGQALFAADLPPARKVIKINRELAENTRDLQRRFNKNIASGKLASFGNNRSRIEQDIVDAQYEHERVRKTNEDAMMVGKKRLEASRADVEEKLLKAAYGEEVALDAADEMAFRYLINERSEQAGDDIEKHLENGKLRMALRLQRADLARRMQIGYDRLMTPAERAIEALSAAIYTPSGKVERYAEKLPASKRQEFMETAMRERLEKVEKALAKLGVTIGQVTGKNRDLQLANSKLMKDIAKLRNVLEQGIIKMVQRGASLTDIKRRYGAIGFDQAQDVIQKAREELFAKIDAMAKSGMSRDQIRDALKDGLKASPLASGAMSEAEIWKMIEEDFGLPENIPAQPIARTPKAKKPKAEKAAETNPLTSDWSRPIFEKGMDEVTFNTKDREGIMQRVEVIRGLAGALGKIDGLTGDNRAKAVAKLAEINAILAKYGTDAAGIFEAAQGIEDYGFDVNDVAQVAAVSRAISMIDADIVDKASEWLYFSMLSGLQTMMVNATAAVPAAWESTVGRGFEMAINRFFKDPMSAQLGESKYIIKAIRPALTRAWSNAQTAFAAQHPMFDRDVLAQEIDWERVMGGKGYRTGGSISGKWGDRLRIPMRILTATDDFNTTAMACAEVGAFAYRIAKAKGMKDGSPEMNAFIEKEVNEPGSFSYVLATEKAKSAIFSNPLPGQHDPVTGKKVPVNDLGDAAGYLAGKLTETFSKEHDNLFVKTAFAAMRIAFFPFQRTPFNILRKGIRYTFNPFSLFDIGLGIVQNSRTADGKWEWNAKGRNPELIRRMAMQMQGAALMLMVAGLAEGDDDDQDKPLVITGSAPFSPRGQAERETGARSGLGPYRFSFRRKDGSERFGFSYGRLEPLATTLAASVDLMKSVKRTLRSGGDASDAASAAMGGFVAQAQDKSFLKGVGDFTELVTNALAEPDLKDNRKMQQFLAGRVAMVMPNIIRQPIRESDSNFRERSANFMQELLYQAVPYGQKPAKVDPYGQSVTKPGTPIGRTVDVTDAGSDTVHPMDRMLLKFRDKHPGKAWFPSVVNSAEFTNRKTGKSEKMNSEQLAEFKRMAGLRLDAALKTARLNLSNPTDRDIETAKELVSKSRSDAKKLLSFKYSR